MEKITTANFITDDRTNRVFLSSLIDKKSGALAVGQELKQSIGRFFPECELLYNTMDVWARDFMPVQLTEHAYLGFTYKPDYLEDFPECVTNWQLHNVHSQKPLAGNSKVVQMPIILDGGNVVKAVVGGKPCFIMCDKVLKDNNVNEKGFRHWWEKWWNNNFNGTEMGLVLLPWEGKKLNPIGHADGMLRYIGEGKVLMANYMDFDKIYNSRHGTKFKVKLKAAGFEVTTLNFLSKFNYREDNKFRSLFDLSWCFINYLQVGDKIMVPSLGYQALDEEAMGQIDRAINSQRHIVDIQLIDVDVTTVVDEMGNQENSGGGLNCLTWTVRA